MTTGSHHTSAANRLHRLGTTPVADEVATAHLAAMAATPVGDPWEGPVGAPAPAAVIAPARRTGSRHGARLKVAAAFATGLVLGGSGLAYAGVLPAGRQSAPEAAAQQVEGSVPRSTEGCPAGQTFKSHGEYVDSVKAAGGDENAAAHSNCGKPVTATTKDQGKNGGKGNGNGNGDGQGNGQGNGKGRGKGAGKHAGDACHGRPPWAGDKTKTEEEKRALEAQREASCPKDDENEADEADEPDKDERGDKDGKESPEATPTTPASPDSTAPPETTAPPAPTTSVVIPTTSIVVPQGPADVPTTTTSAPAP